MKKSLFYLLSFTWGLPMTLIGGMAALGFVMAGHKPEKHGYCMAFRFGSGWGGFSAGPVFFASKTADSELLAHEHGHSIQNCWFGPLFPFIVAIPSAIRYWWRKLSVNMGKTNLPDYYSIWFEGQATRVGLKFMENIQTNEKE